MSERIEAIHLVALAIDTLSKEGKKGHAEAVRIEQEAIRIWKDQLWNKRCPHCHEKL